LQFSRENIFLKKMMNYKIITDLENKVLTSKCEEVKKFDENLIEEIGGMQETMLTPQNKDKVVGVGLAANQVGIGKRMFLLTLNAESKNSKIIPIINPQIIKFSRENLQFPHCWKKYYISQIWLASKQGTKTIYSNSASSHRWKSMLHCP